MTDQTREDGIDWSQTTWEGSRREQIERWSRMSLDQILEAQEELADLSREMLDLGTHARMKQDPEGPGG